MKDWKDMTPGEYLDFLKAELAKVAAKREDPKPMPPAKPWDDCGMHRMWDCEGFRRMTLPYVSPEKIAE